MRFGIAVWNYLEPGLAMADLVRQLAAVGFESMSLQLHVLGTLEAAPWRELQRAVEELDLTVVLHTNFELFQLEHLHLVRDRFGARLFDVTFDAAMETTSRGTGYAMGVMGPVLESIAATAPGLRFGVEDFPLDAAAIEGYAAALQPLLGLPGYGILLDLGHLNLRCRQHPYFQQISAAEYIRRVPLPIHEVHVHDNDGKKDQHMHPGQGQTDLAGAARGLRSVGFDGVNTIEVAPTFHGATPAESRRELPASLAWWRSLMTS